MLLMILTSCNETIHNPMLCEAASLIESSPDSALSMLERISPDKLDNDDQRMYRRLLLLEASDMAMQIHESDKEIQEIISYFVDGNKASRLHPEIYYYAGRTYADLRQDHKALAYFNKALRSLSARENPSLENRIHAQKGVLYFVHNLSAHCKEEFKKHVALTDIIYNDTTKADSRERIGARLTLSCAYLLSNQLDSAEAIFNDLRIPVAKLNDSITTTTFNIQLCQLYIHKGDYKTADSIASLTTMYVDDASKPSVVSISNKIKRHSGETSFDEQAIKSFLDNPNLNIQYNAALTLANIGKQRNDEDMVYEYAVKAYEIVNNIQNEYNENSLAEMDEILNTSELEKELTQISLKRQRAVTWIIILIPFCLLLTSIIIIFINRTKLRKTNFELYVRNMKDSNNNTIINLENQICVLTESIEAERQEISEAQIKLDIERKQLAEGQSQLEYDRLTLATEKENLINKEKKEQLKNDLKLSNIIAHLIDQLSIPEGKITDSDIAALKETLTFIYPGFISRLNELGLGKRDYTDAMFIKINIPQKLCAFYFHTSPASLTNIRKRLFLRHCKDSTSTSWKHFILNI